MVIQKLVLKCVCESYQLQALKPILLILNKIINKLHSLSETNGMDSSLEDQSWKIVRRQSNPGNTKSESIITVLYVKHNNLCK